MIKKPYVVAIGPIGIDEYLDMKNWPVLGDKAVAKPLSMEVGGMISNFSCNLAGFGVKIYILNQFADDQYLELFRNELKKFHVDYSYSKVNKKIKTTRCIVASTNGERTILVVTDKRPIYKLGHKEIKLLEQAEYVYSTITDLQNMENNKEIIKDITGKGVKLVLDIEASTFSSKESEKFYFHNAQILIFNEFGFTKYCKGNDYQLVKEEFASENKIVVITKGPEGFELITKESIFCIKGNKVNVVDTTGAGDMFNATLLAGLMKGKVPLEAAKTANRKAAEHTTHFGPKTSESPLP